VVLKDAIEAVANAYHKSGLLHIGYVAHHLIDRRESLYVPEKDNMPTLVIYSLGNRVVDLKNIYDVETEEVTALKSNLELSE